MSSNAALKDDGIVDEIAVELVLAGKRRITILNWSERAELYRQYVAKHPNGDFRNAFRINQNIHQRIKDLALGGTPDVV